MTLFLRSVTIKPFEVSISSLPTNSFRVGEIVKASNAEKNHYVEAKVVSIELEEECGSTFVKVYFGLPEKDDELAFCFHFPMSSVYFFETEEYPPYIPK